MSVRSVKYSTKGVAMFVIEEHYNDGEVDSTEHEANSFEEATQLLIQDLVSTSSTEFTGKPW